MPTRTGTLPALERKLRLYNYLKCIGLAGQKLDRKRRSKAGLTIWNLWGFWAFCMAMLASLIAG
jgi:hypothetical protein